MARLSRIRDCVNGGTVGSLDGVHGAATGSALILADAFFPWRVLPMWNYPFTLGSRHVGAKSYRPWEDAGGDARRLLLAYTGTRAGRW